MDTLGIIGRNKTAFVLVDIQEKFIPVIDGIEQVISNANILVKAAGILKVPLIVTEQYPKGLGKTSNKVTFLQHAHLIEKVEFSCFACEEFARKIRELKINSIVLFGIEAHVCILQTALDALSNELETHVVSDAIASRTQDNKKIAIERMRQSGVFIVSTEMILFQLLGKAGGEEFNLISSLIK
jgi:nicotinamidase-related amidase